MHNDFSHIFEHLEDCMNLEENVMKSLQNTGGIQTDSWNQTMNAEKLC